MPTKGETMTGPVNGLSRCECGCKYWEGDDTCFDCGFKWRRACEQGCGNPASCYAMGPKAGDWGGWYCFSCAKALGFHITDRLPHSA